MGKMKKKTKKKEKLKGAVQGAAESLLHKFTDDERKPMGVSVSMMFGSPGREEMHGKKKGKKKKDNPHPEGHSMEEAY
jgi:hypothetical protein